MKNFYFLFLILILFGCSASTIYKSGNFDTIHLSIDTVAIIFPHIEYIERTVEGEKPIYGAGIYVSHVVANLLSEILNQKKFFGTAIPMRIDSVFTDIWLPQYYQSSLIQYRDLSSSLKPVNNEKKIFVETDEIKKLIDNVQQKYYFVALGKAFGTSEELKYYDFTQAQTFQKLFNRFFVYDYQWYGLQLDLYLVDKETKTIVWYNGNTISDIRYDPMSEDEVKYLISKIITLR